MKLFTKIVDIITVLFSLSSCKKDYTCICENVVIFPAYENSNNEYVPQEIVQQTYSNTVRTSKKNASFECEMFETSSSVNYPSAQGPVISTIDCMIL